MNDPATLVHTASGADYGDVTESLAVTTTDDDPVGITLSAETLEMDEGDDAAYTVRLATQPTAQVTIAVTGHSGTDLAVSSTALTFTTTNWATVQTVTVAAAEDEDWPCRPPRRRPRRPPPSPSAPSPSSSS